MTRNGSMRARKYVTRYMAVVVLFVIYCLATAGVSILMMSAADTSAQAKGHGGGGHGGGGHGGGGHSSYHGGDHWGGGHATHLGGGRGRGHYWHGRWWGYGVGPCWRLSPGGWIWICG